MKYMIRIQHCLFIVALLSQFFINAQGVANKLGSYITVQGSAFIVIADGGFENDGIFTPGTGTVTFSGSTATANSFISGTATTDFYNLILDKSTGGMQLNRDISVSGTLLLQSGDSLYLNNHNIDLESTGALSGETDSRRITTSSGGYIFSSQDLNAPSAVNPGNLGLEITSSANLGNTIVRRGHDQQGGASVYRYYDIIPTNNVALDAQIKFYYMSVELAGINEANLAFYSSANGGLDWSLIGQDEINTGLKYVAKSNIDQLYRLTLGDPSVPLPVELLYFKAKLQSSQTLINWATATEISNRHFEVQRSNNGTNYNALGIVNGAGNSNTVNYYNYTDVSPVRGKNFYRLKQVDINGQFNFSKVVIVNYDPAANSKIAITPNPATDKLSITFNSLNAGPCIMDIYSVSGKLISKRMVSVDAGENSIEWEIGDLPAGVYIIKVQGNTAPATRFVKQ